MASILPVARVREEGAPRGGDDGWTTQPSYRITDDDRLAFLSSLAVSPEQAARINAYEQRSPEWLAARVNRLSGSRFGAAAGFSEYDTVGDVLRDMLWPRKIEGEALEYGTTMESTAFRVVAERVGHHMRTTLGYASCWIEETGTFICLEHPWLSVSSDGLLFATAGPAMPDRPALRGTIELKARPAKDFYSKVPPHYYAQFMGAAALLGVEFVVFGVYQPEATQINYYTFDRDYWTRTLFPRLRRFYMDCFLDRAILKARGLIAPGQIDVIASPLISPSYDVETIVTGAARPKRTPARTASARGAKRQRRGPATKEV